MINMIKSEDWSIQNGAQSKKKRGTRGSNYTNNEKLILIELTDQFKDIIENKELNMACVIKKRDAWSEIARRYNTAETSGPRTWQQLRHWYDNYKQARKTLTQPATDNGYFPMITSEPHRLFEVIIEEDDSSQQSNSNEQSTDDHSFEQNLVNHEVESVKEEYYEHPSDDCSIEQIRENHNVEPIKEQYYQQSTNGISNDQNTENHRIVSIKEQYYREKLKNAKLEKRLLVNRNRMEIIRHRKEMEILRLKLKILQGRKR